jgi:hypothetical protein
LSELKFSISLMKFLSFSEKIQSSGRRWNIYAKGYTSRGATRFRPVPHIVQCPKHMCLSRSPCWWHLYICNRQQTCLCSDKDALKSHCYWDMVWALEHKNQGR